MAEKLNIYQKLLAVRKQITGISKDAKTNFGDKFKYVSSGNILAELRPLLDDQGLVWEVRTTGHRLKNKWDTDSGGVKPQNEHLTELDVQFVWVNADNPEERIVCDCYGQGLDTGEKGVGKAWTYAEKYFLLKFFMIPTDEDDPDRGGNGNGNGNGHSASRSRQDDVGHAQYNGDGTPANAAAGRHNAAPVDPESITDLAQFNAAMLSIGVDDSPKMGAAKTASGYGADKLATLDVSALQKIYAIALAAKEAAA